MLNNESEHKKPEDGNVILGSIHHIAEGADRLMSLESPFFWLSAITAASALLMESGAGEAPGVIAFFGTALLGARMGEVVAKETVCHGGVVSPKSETTLRKVGAGLLLAFALATGYGVYNLEKSEPVNTPLEKRESQKQGALTVQNQPKPAVLY